MKRVAVVGIIVVIVAVTTAWSQNALDFWVGFGGVRSMKTRAVPSGLSVRAQPAVVYYTDVVVGTNENPSSATNHIQTTHLWVRDWSTNAEVCHAETTFSGKYKPAVSVLRFQVTYPASVNAADKVKYKFQSRIIPGDQNENNDLQYFDFEYPRGGTPVCRKLK